MRMSFPYATSHRIDEMEIALSDGSRRRVLMKNVEASAHRAARPEWLIDAHREAVAYQLLAEAGLGAPACFGVDAGWLVLEKIEGVPLWQRGDLDSWVRAARWLAAFHRFFEGADLPPEHLLRYEARYFRVWPERALLHHPEVARVVSRYEGVVEILASLPVTLVHGEFYPSNVVTDGERIAPVDWEMAGLGQGVLDLAALVTGWSGDERAEIVSAYGEVPAEALAAAEMHLAMQWLGWGADWTPPAEHARDWVAEVRNAAERLRL